MAEIDSEQLLEWFAAWKNDGISQLTTIKGYSDILLRGLVGDLSDKQREFIEIIARSCEHAVDYWNFPSDYLQLRYSRYARPDLQESDLKKIFEEILSQSGRAQNVKLELPAELPTIKSSYTLRSALSVLLHPSFEFDLKHQGNTETCTVQITRSGQTELSVRIFHNLLIINHRSPQLLLYPGKPLAVADLIIQQHGSQLEIIPSDSGTEFRFTLPIWQDPTDAPSITNNQ